MSKQYLDKTGLSYFWGKIKAYVDAHGGNVDSTPVPTASKVAEFDTYAHMNSADMTAQEVEDFVDSLDTHTLDVTYMKRDLLWTNSTDPFASQTVSLDLSAYDYIEVWFNSRIGTVDAMLPNPLQIPKNERREIVHIHGLGDTNANENIGMRGVTVSATGVTFGNYAYKNRRTGGGLTVANQFAVPNKIYGVKYY